ncbi:MAG: hypothetical protein A2W52_01140 [Candidatus Taylorbacteria bacterium RIFCSPHIGHO2_02_49_25]|uniref:Methyltransferase n=1 Tax=Candidatus Taylorbacteria bacterium RIFCSPHIGHO2_02_49_25 TaxID=1802305 RepID=A0A1G2MAU6_9BACT|nr:MAG: hypothetical protein UY62_C0008G0014 [Parcubacteria group bacterium GW2011_GWF2_50_9]OHA19183.1 MAG: hypothetical protein A2759_00640 [Candidatus Taylorbacteria bacterium RIFCSPHIGHO2_01_FULL_49_60]OHA20988.1 MAG: hypothetical protein A2W52_01140 [Candidatus Taylorbacteria bacterium RIFCSPHIGHO2_02_49_25]OHA36761.1 MAG: hypothetical protein A3B27_01700 [Candidatus Taylorbacteria bacterium RIFCSPLOWO2_01_FULL_50_130]OHA37287.1 MAG: hypothetical protein A2W65_03385 [Candidatus Taylorbacte
MSCFICNNTNLFAFLDLGQQPPSDAFLRREDLEKPEARFPLSLNFCEECGLVQLGHIVDPKVLFTEYVYTTGMNNSLRENFKMLVEKLVKRFKLGKNDFAIDIGSNDGTLLQNYAPFGVQTLGIDPSSASLLAKEKGIPTLTAFFNEETASEVKKEYKTADVITATNVFAHVADLHSFLRGVKFLLAPSGVFVSESGYLLDMLETLGYDAIYHEHLRYYALHPLARLFAQYGMEIFDAERIPSHNGSIRVFAARKGAYPVAQSIGELLALEESAKLREKETLMQFAKRVHEHKHALRKLISDIRTSGKRAVGIGAPAKGNTLLNFCGFGVKEIEYLAEKSELKIGLFAPGSRIPVVAEERLFRDQPDYALLLSWNLSDELIPKLRNKGYRGKFIVLFPEVHVV